MDRLKFFLLVNFLSHSLKAVRFLEDFNSKITHYCWKLKLKIIKNKKAEEIKNIFDEMFGGIK
jgi:hypothetical protein